MNGETPLHLACKNGNIQLVEMLMERSEELNIVLRLELSQKKHNSPVLYQHALHRNVDAPPNSAEQV